MKILTTLTLAASFALPAAFALAQDGPSKIDIAIVWGEKNCDAIEIPEAASKAAREATASMSDADFAAKADEIEATIKSSFDGDRAEYCGFISDMAAGL